MDWRNFLTKFPKFPGKTSQYFFFSIDTKIRYIPWDLPGDIQENRNAQELHFFLSWFTEPKTIGISGPGMTTGLYSYGALCGLNMRLIITDLRIFSLHRGCHNEICVLAHWNRKIESILKNLIFNFFYYWTELCIVVNLYNYIPN